jgi:hypothetical protein
MSLITTMCESTAIIQRATIGQDSADGTTQEPWVTIQGGPNALGNQKTPLPVSNQQKNASIIDVYGQRNIVVRGTLQFPGIFPVCEANDRVIVNNVRTGHVDTYLVLGKAQPVARGRIYEVEVEKIRQPGGDPNSTGPGS